MLRLIVVKSPNEDIECDTNANINHGAATSRRIVEPFRNSNRFICRNSYFGSVATVQELLRVGMRFIGVVKIAHRNFRLEYLGSVTREG